MPTILVTLPGGLSSDGVQVAVPVDDQDGTVPWVLDGDVLVRPAFSSQRWERLAAVGGSVEIR